MLDNLNRKKIAMITLMLGAPALILFLLSSNDVSLLLNQGGALSGDGINSASGLVEQICGAVDVQPISTVVDILGWGAVFLFTFGFGLWDVYESTKSQIGSGGNDGLDKTKAGVKLLGILYLGHFAAVFLFGSSPGKCILPLADAAGG